MFGWAFIIATGYCKAHGLIPDPEKLLDFKQWGTLAIISGGKGGGITITNERACILVANIHFLVVSAVRGLLPAALPGHAPPRTGEPDEEPAGLVPAFDTGLTPAAELWNGRLAMLGLIIFSAYSMIYQIPFLNAVDNALGGLLLAPAARAAVAAVVEAVAEEGAGRFKRSWWWGSCNRFGPVLVSLSRRRRAVVELAAREHGISTCRFVSLVLSRRRAGLSRSVPLPRAASSPRDRLSRSSNSRPGKCAWLLHLPFFSALVCPLNASSASSARAPTFLS